MINDHLVANIAQYFNFLPSQRYLKGCTKFILTVCVVYNSVISNRLTWTKTFSINSTHSWIKPAYFRLCTNMSLLIFLAQTPPEIIVESVLSGDVEKRALSMYSKCWTDRKMINIFSHKSSTASENVSEMQKERKTNPHCSPAAPCKSCFHVFFIPFYSQSKCMCNFLHNYTPSVGAISESKFFPVSDYSGRIPANTI